MAWWDSHRRRLRDRSPRSRARLAVGDAFPRLGPAHAHQHPDQHPDRHPDRHPDMERDRALLPPVLEEQPGPPPTAPALVVHVDVRFTDPVVRSRYTRSYESSPGFQATNKICRGLVRRIERCSEELITRKDSGALDMFKEDTYERKPQRFEMTFRITRRGKGEWAERTYRSYQEQPLTAAHTREVALAVHRMIGLFLRRHDEGFLWLDSPAPEADSDQSESASSFGDGPLSLLSVPASRFVEATQTFESLPGYSVDLYFRSRNPQRRVPTYERRIKVASTQTAPLTLSMSRDLLRRVLQFANRDLDARKQELDDYLQGCRLPDHAHPQDETLELSVSVANHLGPTCELVQNTIRSKLALFRHPEARDCESFFCELETHLSRVRDEADAMLNRLDDFEVRIVELKGVGWTLRHPARFTIGPEASYGRRTIQAALDRIQTGVGDVIRGHNIAVHIAAQKRGHTVLDKAIVAHERRGRPKETFASHEEAQETFVSRLRARIQKDLDKVFEDTCSIDDIPEIEDDYVPTRSITPQPPETAVLDGPSPGGSPSSSRSSLVKWPAHAGAHASPKPRWRRLFSLHRRSTESVRSIDYLTTEHDGSLRSSSRASSVASERAPPPHERGQPESPLPDGRGGLLLAPAEIEPTRAFSLVSPNSSTDQQADARSTENRRALPVSCPKIFVDAEEDVGGPVPEKDIRSALGGAPTVLRSSLIDDDLSTAPSTPGLSTGASSPRQSLLATPGERDAVLRYAYPEFEPGGDVVQLYLETALEPACSEDGNRPAVVDEPFVCPQAPPQSAACQSPTAGKAGHAPGDTSAPCVPGDPAPDLSYQTLPDAVCQQERTSRPSTPSPEHNPTESAEKPEGQPAVQTEHVGPELTTVPDSLSSLAPGFPIAESETQESDPNREQAHASSESPASGEDEPVPGRPESPLARGPGDAARAGVFVAGESEAAGDGELAVAPVAGEVTSGTAQPGSESFIEPNTGLALGNEVEGGSEPSAAEQQQQQAEDEDEPAAPESACQGVDSAEKPHNLGDDASAEAPAPESVCDGDSMEAIGAETDAAPGLFEASTGDKLETPSQSSVMLISDLREEAAYPEAVSHVGMVGVGVQDSGRPESEIDADAEDEANRGLPSKAFGPEITVDGISKTPETGPGESHGTAATCANELSPSGLDTSGSSTETGQVADAGPSTEPPSPAEPPTVETPAREAAPSPTPQATKDQVDLLAPTSDVSTLCNSSLVRPCFSISSDAASLATTTTSSSSSSIPIARNSIDTIRPSTDEPRYPVSAEQHLSHASGSDSWPQTAGHLGVGLRCGSHLFEVGLRCALGDVPARGRTSLPLQRCLLPDSEDREKSRPCAPASEPGGDDCRCSGGDEPSALPRMVLLLAGVVAVGKILKKAAE
ncbi:hypothetical protein VTH06DRAFT_420 [Thermothelomyces fergusii]